ncbi:MAG TPA: hypothetical protein VGD15_12755 [Kribbella sp.]
MSTEIEDLLAEAADDSAEPMRHSVDDVVRRGRRGVRYHRAGVVAAVALTAGAVIGGVNVWAGGHDTDGVQPAGTAGVTVTMDVHTGRVVGPPASKLSDAQIINRCKAQDNRWLAEGHQDKAGGGTDSISGWKVAVTQAQGPWIRAILTSPDHQRWAICQNNLTSGSPADYYLREDLQYQTDFIVWSDRDGSEGKVPKNVSRITFELPNGIVYDATLKNGFFLWSAELTFDDVKGKPIWAVFYDSRDREVARFDSNVNNPVDGYNADRQPIFRK